MTSPAKAATNTTTSPSTVSEVFDTPSPETAPTPVLVNHQRIPEQPTFVMPNYYDHNINILPQPPVAFDDIFQDTTLVPFDTPFQNFNLTEFNLDAL